MGLKDLGEDICEMKRLYVYDRFQALGLGKALCEALFGHARAAGFEKMRLDTLPRLTRAAAMYRRYGFVDIPRYNCNTGEGVIFMERSLTG